MKTAKYESSPGALAAFIARKPKTALRWDLYTFNLAGSIGGGTPLLYANGDIDVSVPYLSGTVLYPCKKLAFLDQPSFHQKAGLDVDTWQVPVSPMPSTVIGGQPFLQALRAGVLDGAIVTVDRAVFDTINSGVPVGGSTATPLGVVNIFTGIVADIDIARSGAVWNFASYVSVLGTNMPRNSMQHGCRWTLFDSGCTLSAASFAVSGTVASNTTSNLLSATVAAPNGSGTYALGRIAMTSGANAGFSRAVKSWTPGSPASLVLAMPFYYPVIAGDTFTAYPGCDKSRGHCGAFANSQHFGGFEYVPVAETAAVAG